MINKNTTNDILALHNKRFQSELKIYVNEQLYNKRIITEDMYSQAKEILLKKAS